MSDTPFGKGLGSFGANTDTNQTDLLGGMDSNPFGGPPSGQMSKNFMNMNNNQQNQGSNS